MFLILFLRNVFSRAFRRRALLRATGMLLIIYFSIAIGVFLAERANPSGNIKSIGDAFWFPLITLTTIGYGDKFPVTGMGRVITAIGILAGLGLMATLLSELPALAMARAERRENGLVPLKVKNHAIVCNWHEEAPTLIRELLAGETTIQDVVVISPGDRPFDDCPHWHFVRGNPSEEEVLQRANIKEALAVISFPSEEDILREAEIADSLSLMLQSTVRQMAPSAWRGVFLQREENRGHFESSGVNSIINSDRLGAILMVQSLQDPGVETMVRRLLSNLEGNTLFRTTIPPKGFINWGALSLYCRTQGWLPVALVRGEEVIENPPDETVLKADDEMIVIAPSRPVTS